MKISSWSKAVGSWGTASGACASTNYASTSIHFALIVHSPDNWALRRTELTEPEETELRTLLHPRTGKIHKAQHKIQLQLVVRRSQGANEAV